MPTTERGAEGCIESAKGAVLRYLEHENDTVKRRGAWERFAALCRRTEDWTGEVHALVEISAQEDTSFVMVSNAINRFNQIFRQQLIPQGSDERYVLGKRLTEIFEAHGEDANATDCSRMAWLCLSLHEEVRAREYTTKGLQIEPQNEYCLNLAARLNMQLPLGT